MTSLARLVQLWLFRWKISPDDEEQSLSETRVWWWLILGKCPFSRACDLKRKKERKNAAEISYGNTST